MTAVPGDAAQVLLTLQLSNRNSALIKSMIFNVVDSAGARLLRGPHEHDGVELPQHLNRQAKIEISLAIAIDDSSCSHHLRGVLTYMALMDKESLSDKMDFKLKIPCSIFLIQTSISSDSFAELVVSEQLSAKAEITCEGVSLSWVQFYLSFFVFL